VDIRKLQTDLKAAGHYSGTIDGKWGPMTEAGWEAYMKTKVYKGSTFPYDPYKSVSVILNKNMRDLYLPAIAHLRGSEGIKLLATVMAFVEGYYVGSRSFKTNNPGNVGNTDNGAHKTFRNLAEGIEAQIAYLVRVSRGEHTAYPLGKLVILKPFYSKEIAKNRKTYGIPPQLPGYEFTYTGQLDQFIKIYSTGARVLNTYLNQIVSYFFQNGFVITPETKLI
jgi:hypothetical protein